MKKAISLLITSACLLNCIPAFAGETADIASETKKIYNVSVLPEKRQTVTDWGICTSDGGPDLDFTYATEYPATHTASVKDSGITMFRTNVPCMYSYTEDKKFVKEYIERYINTCIKPQMDAGLTRYYMCCWWPPEWMRYTDNRGWIHLKPECEDDFAEYLVKVLDYITSFGYPAPIAYSIQNEPSDPGINNYDTEQFVRVTKKIRKAFDEAGYKDVKLAATDAASIWQAYMQLGDNYSALFNDKEFADAIQIFTHHSYLQRLDPEILRGYVDALDRLGGNRERWQTEFCTSEFGYDKNAAIDTLLSTMKVFSSDMEWAGCNAWMFWTDFMNFFNMREDGSISSWGRDFQIFGHMAIGVSKDDGSTSYRKTPIYNALKLIYKNAPVGSVVHRMTTDDTELCNEVGFQTDLTAFETPSDTNVVMITNTNNDKIYNINNLKGKSAAIYKIEPDAYYKIKTSYKNVDNGTVSDIEIPHNTVCIIVTENDDIAPPSFKLDLDPLIFEKEGTYFSRNENIDFSGYIDETDAKVYLDGKQIKLTDGNFSEKINIVDNDTFTLTAVDKSANRSEPFVTRFKCLKDYVGIMINDYSVKNNNGKVTLTGKVNTDSTVYAADKSVKSKNNEFSVDIDLREGENSFEIYAVDEQQNKSAETNVRISCDTVYPEVQIKNTYLTSNVPQYMLMGNVSEKLASLSINGKAAAVRDDLSFVYVIDLKENSNSVNISAVDMYGNKTEKNITLNYIKDDSTPHLVQGEAYTRKATGHITVDGKLDESDWKIDNVIYKLTEGTRDNVAKFGTLWDNQYLYIAAVVKDDKVKFEGSAPFNNDCIELFFNSTNKKAGAYTGNDKQMWSTYIDGNMKSAYKNTNGEMNSAWTFTDDGYICEIAVPWDTIGTEPGDGVEIGFDIVCNDNDAGAEIRNACLAWWGTADNYRSTAGFGTLILTSGENITYKDIPYDYFERKTTEENNQPTVENGESEYSVVMNGNKLSSDIPVVVQDGRWMIPIDTFFKEVGAAYEWGLGRNIIATLKDGKDLNFYDTITDVTYDNKFYTFEKPAAYLYNNNLYISFELIKLVYGAEVTVDDASKTINIKAVY